MIYVDGGIAGAISGSTINSGFHTSSLGIIPYTSTDGIELYNGEFGGTVITATTQTSIGDQTEVSSIQYNGVETSYTTYSLDYLYQNVSASVRSERFFNLDYTSDQLTPINLGLITQSINSAVNDNYNTYTNPNNPYLGTYSPLSPHHEEAAEGLWLIQGSLFVACPISSSHLSVSNW
jgi:hypothetical protein